MKCSTRFVRARQPEQKEQRRSQILDATARLLESQGFDKLSLNGIARECGIAKSNLYRYFESREDILSQLLKEDWTHWLEELETDLSRLSGSNDLNAITDVLTRSIVRNPRMCQLMSVLASVLEKNISEETLYKFKSESVQLGMRLLQLTHSVVPDIPIERLMPAIQNLFALIAGLWPLCNPNPTVEAVMNRPELAPFKLEFEAGLKNSISLMLKGATKAD